MGIDEAGYGPNLGPFVMSSALFHLPDGCSTDLWKTLHAAVRKANQKADGRLIVDDSKQVYSPKVGLGLLEKSLWPFIALNHPSVRTVDDLWQCLTLTSKEAVQHEPYYNWTQSLPLAAPSVSSMAILSGILANVGVRLEHLRTSVITPRAFNQLTREVDSKAGVPVHSIKQLVNHLPADKTIDITVDRLGGRQRYEEPIKQWFPGESVAVEMETPALSRYRVGSRITISFQVEGDQHSFPVALASMLSKYWRELLMGQFNVWFAKEQPGVTPTAGYPLDATRFWSEVEPTRQRLDLLNDDWWRER